MLCGLVILVRLPERAEISVAVNDFLYFLTAILFRGKGSGPVPIFCRQRFVCSHRARCDLLRRFLTCVEIHVHFVMYTSAYIDSLIIKYCSVVVVYIPIYVYDNVTMDEVEVKNMEIAIENVARRRRVMAMQLIILSI